ncbi:hypothetical protein D3P07_01080 [Paenibacillus sp. 1011MAR3C5]|uniref:hypothetical protein n=1 Tax=Paenibacillus sp. 1011MAR3C5 TaxID=1675787 RepID=UPI000E6B5549|nr:hypothetical protein [Paenibacillus sp. 1011MAR3C5]RJE90729.1 hypothetical protein D3P07_01080 [Paenibacillus sp. 1011MAR3C5]
MFDTLTIVADCRIPETGLKCMMDQRARVKYLNPGEEEEDELTTFSYELQNDPLMPRLKFNKDRGRVTITIPCCSYFMFGYRMKRMDATHVSAFIDKLQQSFVNDLAIEFLRPADQWRVRSGDAYYDFKVPDVAAQVQAIAQLSLAGYKTVNYRYETAAFENGSKDCKFYDKRAQLIEKGCQDKRDLELSQNVMRFEVGVVHYDMNRHVKSQQLGHVMSESFVNDYLERFLRRLNLSSLVMTNERDIHHRLKEMHGEKWADTLLGFIVKRTNGIHTENERQEREYLKRIAQAGIAPVISNVPLPPLLFPWMDKVPNVPVIQQPFIPLVVDRELQSSSRIVLGSSTISATTGAMRAPIIVPNKRVVTGLNLAN